MHIVKTMFECTNVAISQVSGDIHTDLFDRLGQRQLGFLSHVTERFYFSAISASRRHFEGDISRNVKTGDKTDCQAVLGAILY